MAKKNQKMSEEEKLFNAEFRRVRNSAKRTCKEQGLRAAELQLGFLKEGNTRLPSTVLSLEQNIEAFETGINIYKGVLTAPTVDGKNKKKSKSKTKI